MVRLTTQVRGAVRRDRRWHAAAEWWSLAIASAVTLAVGLVLPWEPDRVSVTITNPTDHVLYINASTPDNDSLSSIVIVSPRSTADIREVIDRGSRWVLHLRTRGSAAATIEASRTELLDGSFTIPISLNDHLARAGVPADVTDQENGGETR